MVTYLGLTAWQLAFARSSPAGAIAFYSVIQIWRIRGRIKREKQVSEIVESDYFQRLRDQVAQLRQARKDKPKDQPDATGD